MDSMISSFLKFLKLHQFVHKPVIYLITALDCAPYFYLGLIGAVNIVYLFGLCFGTLLYYKIIFRLIRLLEILNIYTQSTGTEKHKTNMCLFTFQTINMIILYLK